jgi:hypothetical protein
MNKFSTWMKKALFVLLGALLILSQAGSLGAATVYDRDGDGDSDGFDLYRLISDTGVDLGVDLPDFAYRFGLVDSAGDTIGIGTPIDGYPNWQERTLLVFTNMARMAPTEYRDRFMTAYAMPPGGILNQGFPPVAPLSGAHPLNLSARYHAADMAFNCNHLQHDSCDGTPWYERIRSFYPQASSLGENVAYLGGTGTDRPWVVVNLFLCDEYNGTCAADDQPFAVIGHRVNLMSDGYTEMGSGFALGSRRYWVQDFNGGPLSAQPPVAAGSHAMVDSGETTFYLNYYDEDGSAPQNLSVIVDGQSHALALGSGDPEAGTYETMLPGADGCRSYYFLATDAAGNRYRYPGEGAFYTYGEGDCGLDYATSEN